MSCTHALTLRQIEVKISGEEGPRRLNEHTTMALQSLPWLSVTEFLRAKLKDWTLCAALPVPVSLLLTSGPLCNPL